MCLELYIRAKSGSQGNVIVDLSIDGEDGLSILTDERLRAGICKLGEVAVKNCVIGPADLLRRWPDVRGLGWIPCLHSIPTSQDHDGEAFWTSL